MFSMEKASLASLQILQCGEESLLPMYHELLLRVWILHYFSLLEVTCFLVKLLQLQMSIKSPERNNLSRKRKFVTASISNKRTKAYRLHVEEVQRALKDWEKHLNSISTDPAPISVENNVDLEGPPHVNILHVYYLKLMYMLSI
jgi:hypothetical protein